MKDDLDENVRGLEEAIKKAGGQKALAELLDVWQGAISNWKNRDKRIPAERVLEIERLTGVPRQRLRPDLFRRTKKTMPENASEVGVM